MPRTMRMPYQALIRFGVLCDQSAKARVLWQKLQLTPIPSDICIIRI